MRIPRAALCSLLVVLVAMFSGQAGGNRESIVAGEAGGGLQRVQVSAATRLDWMFALANQSLKEPPTDWLKNYESTDQAYASYIPSQPAPEQGYPLVLFISAGGNPVGWEQWQAICRQHGILFASPYDAGNGVALDRRVRIVIDVLDDLRRKYRIDPDRTYLGGFSGGGRVACSIAFALPEYFGGVIPVCAAGDLRQEPWLRQRVIDRLSVAHVTGERDFNRGEIERFRSAVLAGVGVRTRVWTVPGMGHALPDSEVFAETYAWLESDRPRREQLVRDYPAAALPAGGWTREAWSAALFEEGVARLKTPKTVYSGLMSLQGVMHRWPDLPSSMKAKEILLEYQEREERAWEQDDIAEQRRFLIANARGLDAYATGELPEQYAPMRRQMLEAAMRLWQVVLRDGQDAAATEEANRRLPVLAKLLGGDDD